MSELPEAIRVRMAEQAAESPLETVRQFLMFDVADAADYDEIRTSLQALARTSTRRHRRVLAALDTVVAGEWPPGLIGGMVAAEGNWVLDDPSDAGAVEFLRGLAAMIRGVLDEG